MSIIEKERCRCGAYKRNIYKDCIFTGSRICVKCSSNGRCPNCGNKLRTKAAEQCPHCSASWRVVPPSSLENFSKQFEKKIDNRPKHSLDTNVKSHFRPKKRYLFFDVETTGIPKNWNAPVSDLDNWPRIVEIAWMLCDEQGNELEADSAILKNDNFLIPMEASEIHHITDEIANTKGRDRVMTFKLFAETISKAQILVAHNMEFDYKVLHSEFIRYNIKSAAYKIDKICTKELTTDFCKLPGNYGYKWPKLEELYYKVFGKELFGAHSALIDVKACKDCFFELADRGVFRLFGSNVLVDTITDVDDDSLIHIDPFREETNYNGYYQYYTRVRHLGLNEQKFLKAGDEYTLEDKVERQKERFKFEWENEKKKTLSAQIKQAKNFEAEYQTQEAEQRIHEIENLLENILHLNPTLDWKQLKNQKQFEEPSPEGNLENIISQVTKPQKPEMEQLYEEPIDTDEAYQPSFNFIEKYMVKSLKEKKIDKSKSLFLKTHKAWSAEKNRVEKRNREHHEKYLAELDNYNQLIDAIKIQNIRDIEAWQKRKLAYQKHQDEHNGEIEKFRMSYFNKEKSAILTYCNLVLNNSEYPNYFPKIFNMIYVEEGELLIVDYCLPEKTNLPSIKSVKYLNSEDVFKETNISETKLISLHASLVFQTCVRTKNELYKSDVCNALKYIYFNGYLNEDDKQFIISVISDKETFLNTQLKGVDCKDVVKKFEGNFNNKLSTIEPTITTK